MDQNTPINTQVTASGHSAILARAKSAVNSLLGSLTNDTNLFADLLGSVKVNANIEKPHHTARKALPDAPGDQSAAADTASAEQDKQDRLDAQNLKIEAKVELRAREKHCTAGRKKNANEEAETVQQQDSPADACQSDDQVACDVSGEEAIKPCLRDEDDVLLLTEELIDPALTAIPTVAVQVAQAPTEDGDDELSVRDLTVVKAFMLLLADRQGEVRPRVQNLFDQKPELMDRARDILTDMKDAMTAALEGADDLLPDALLKKMIATAEKVISQLAPDLTAQATVQGEVASDITTEIVLSAAVKESQSRRNEAEKFMTQVMDILEGRGVSLDRQSSQPLMASAVSAMAKSDIQLGSKPVMGNQSSVNATALTDGAARAHHYEKISELSFTRVVRGGSAGLPAVIEQVSLQLHKAARNGVEQISVQLRPAELGRIDVKLEFDQGAVRGTVTVDQPQTLDLLLKDVRSLERALQDAGLRADAGSLSFQLRGDDRQGQQDANNNGQQDGSDGAFSLDGLTDEIEAGAEADAEIYYVRPGRVNLKV